MFLFRSRPEWVAENVSASRFSPSVRDVARCPGQTNHCEAAFLHALFLYLHPSHDAGPSLPKIPLLPVSDHSDIAAALAGNTMDTANIIESRTRRKKGVDYVKLNQTVFG